MTAPDTLNLLAAAQSVVSCIGNHDLEYPALLVWQTLVGLPIGEATAYAYEIVDAAVPVAAAVIPM